MNNNHNIEIRKQIKLFYEENIRKGIEYICNKEKENLHEILYYMLVIIEDGFNGTNPIKQESGKFKRVAVEWFIKQLLIKDINFSVVDYEHIKFKKYSEYLDEIFNLYSMSIISESIEESRGLNVIKIEQIKENEYELIFPEIKDDINLQQTYFKGEQRDIEIKSRPFEYINKVYKCYEPGIGINKLKERYNTLQNLDTNIDIKLYNLYKESVKCDIEKIGIDFRSEIINSKNELIDILGFVHYIASINAYKSVLIPYCDGGKPKQCGFVLSYKKDKFINLISNTTGISSKVVNKYINYLLFTKQGIGRLNEYPLLEVEDYIIFIPSSIILNDFQFSIVNGHYYKDIDIIDRKDTVSQSVVDKIYNKCKGYENILIIRDKEYYVEEVKYKDRIFKSDIDIGIYDYISNTALILECKWKDNVFLNKLNYRNIEKAVRKSYIWQLGKHKAFIELDEKNIDDLFNNHELIKSKPYFPIVRYMMVDKRAQYHCDNNHIVSEFILLHLIDKYSNGNKLRLDLIIDEIQSMRTKVEYQKSNIKETEVINNDIIIHNNKNYTKVY